MLSFFFFGNTLYYIVSFVAAGTFLTFAIHSKRSYTLLQFVYTPAKKEKSHAVPKQN